MVHCRICEREIEYILWKDHTKLHKVEFCKRQGIDLEHWHKVKWSLLIDEKKGFQIPDAKPLDGTLKVFIK